MGIITAIALVAIIAIAASKIAEIFGGKTTAQVRAMGVRGKVLRHLGRCGCMPQQNEDMVRFSFRGFIFWFRNAGGSKESVIGAQWEKIEEMNRNLLLDAVNTANRECELITAFVAEDGGISVVITFYFHSQATFKKQFDNYCNCILHGHARIMEVYEELVKKSTDTAVAAVAKPKRVS